LLKLFTGFFFVSFSAALKQCITTKFSKIAPTALEPTFTPDVLIMRSIVKLCWLLLLATPLPLTVHAESDWFTRVWQTDEGLPNNTITGLAQTSDGYLWLATPSGLVSFDGVDFNQFSLMDLAGNQNRGILAMTSNHANGLILAMDRGAIVNLNSEKTQVFNSNIGLPNLVPQSAMEDGEGVIWIVYRGGSVWQIKDGKGISMTEENGLPAGPSACSLTVDNKGHLWFVKAGQFGTVRKGQFQTLLQLDRVTTCLAPARDGGIWICPGFRLLKYTESGKLEDFGSLTTNHAGIEPTVMFESDDSAVWIGTSGNGLFRYNGTSFEKITTSHSQILSLLEDREDNLWVGTGGGGLDRIRQRSVKLEGTETGLPEAVQSLCQDDHGVLWATTQNGLLVHWVDNKWKPIATEESWPGDATCVVADHSDTVWVGTQHHGLLCCRDGHLISWPKADQVKGHAIRAMLVSKSGDLWIGEENTNSLQCLHGDQLQDFELPPNIRLIRAIAQDNAGNIWVGTSKGVLLRVNGNQLTDETTNLFGEPLSIRYLYATPDGSLWIGFAGWGLGRIKNGQFSRISDAQGLYDNYISQIISDGRGNLWFGSNRGIFKVSLQELDAVAEGRASHLRSVHYGQGEGLPSLQADFGYTPGALRTRDGWLWIPTRSGIVVVNPDSLTDNLEPPPVLVKRIMLDDQILAQYQGVVPEKNSSKILDLRTGDLLFRLPANYNRLEIDYTAMSFFAPENVQFRYQLEGVDKGWIEAGTQRSVAYSRLPAGTYHFRVIASNREGVWSELGAGFAFVVLPFFWETWTFQLIVFGAFTLCIVLIVRYLSFRRLRLRLQRVEQQAALYKERARIAKDIHDDLGANLTQIALLSELVRHDSAPPSKTDAHTHKISATARQAIKSLDEIVWAVNPRNDTLAQLMDYTGQFALDYLESAEVRCRLDFPDQIPDRQIPTNVRHNLFLVVKEALNNVVKHAQADEVWLRLFTTDMALQIEIEDNGRGFGQTSDSPGADGLGNMRQRMKEIGGACRIESRVGKGTKIIIEFPWPRH
jgi:signal transduction histidine kinase/ligand-binding sensor domain-containing protein